MQELGAKVKKDTVKEGRKEDKLRIPHIWLPELPL